MLGQPHRPATDHAIRPAINFRRLLDLLSGQPALIHQKVPGSLPDHPAVLLESMGVAGDKFTVEKSRIGFGFFQNGLGHGPHRGQIAPDAGLVVMGADRGAASENHVGRMLGVGKVEQTSLAEGIKTDNACPASGSLLQFRQHARVVGPRVLAEDENRIGFPEIFQRDGPLSGGQRLPHAHPAGFMAHVRAVGEVVGAVEAPQELVKKRRFVAGSPRRVKNRLIRRGQRTEVPGDPREGLVPTDRLIAVGLRIVGHGVREPSGVLQGKIVPSLHFRHGVARKQLRRGTLRGGLVRQRLDPVLAELGDRSIRGVGPGATGTIEAARLVHAEKRLVPLEEAFPLQEMKGGKKSAPSAGLGFGFSHDCFICPVPHGPSRCKRLRGPRGKIQPR